MTDLIVALYSREDKSTGLGIFDSDCGKLKYLQLFSMPKEITQPILRGIFWDEHNRLMYVNSRAGISIINIDSNPDRPIFTTQDIIILPEWLKGRQQAKIIGILPQPKKERIIVGNNRLCSFDFISLKGKLIERYPIWKLIPILFKAPGNWNKPEGVGEICCIFEDQDSRVYATVANINNTQMGAIIRIDDGEVILTDIETPHGGLIDGGAIFYQDKQKATLISHQFNSGAIGDEIFRSKIPVSSPNLKLRWTTLLEGIVWCGAFHVGKSMKGQEGSRLFGFDSATGDIVREISLPHLIRFRWARPFGMMPAPDSLHELISALPAQTGWDINGDEFEIIPSDDEGANKKEQFNHYIPDGNTNYISEVKQNSSARVAIDISKVGLFYMRAGRFALLKDRHLRRNRYYWALKDITLTIQKGQCVGIIGRNGSGKSTLSMLCAGILEPDMGKISRYGTVRLLALGAGFRPELTGRENVRISAAIMGLSQKETIAKMNEIESFAELGEFMDEPIRTYSAGMRSRLGFAVATAVTPEILVLDEAMATGDAAFRFKAQSRLQEMLDNAGTVIMVSHSVGQVRKFCDRVIWLEKSRIIMDGDTNSVTEAYSKFCENPELWKEDHPELFNAHS